MSDSPLPARFTIRVCFDDVEQSVEHRDTAVLAGACFDGYGVAWETEGFVAENKIAPLDERPLRFSLILRYRHPVTGERRTVMWTRNFSF